jgi:putative redox protein
MKSTVVWKEKMLFEGKVDNNAAMMDAKPPFGSNSALTPKEMIVIGLGGCTAMDVIALMKKHKQAVEKFEVTLDVDYPKDRHPHVFKSATLNFNLVGEIDSTILIESVKLSQEKFCGVSAMLSHAFPIYYKINLNEVQVGEGQAHFS